MHVIINGGGLVGALTAIYMLQHTRQVTVVEKRTDLRTATAESGRSINLILTSRGLYALRQVKLEKQALALCVPVEGRIMHDNKVDATEVFQPYGVSSQEVNYSVSRTALNALLIDEAQRRGARFFFEHELVTIDFQAMCAVYKCGAGSLQMKADLFFGTDGVGSVTREHMNNALKGRGVQHVDAVMERLGISYKELTFHAKTASTESDSMQRVYPMNQRGLHIWPRGAHFLMALADKQQTFTGTLYLPDGSTTLNIPSTGGPVPTFEELGNDAAKYEAYFQNFYPDVPKIVPDYKTQLSERQHSFLATLRATHWTLEGKCCLLGDAAHGVVPFFGQGMNLGFESVEVLHRFLDRYGGLNSATLPQALNDYTAYHKASATAIADMAIENFSEMSCKVGLPDFLARKRVEHHMEKTLPTLFRSRYYMVTKTLIPYKRVQEAGALLDRCVDAVMQDAKAAVIASKGGNANGVTLNDIVERVESFSETQLTTRVAEHVTPFFAKHGIRVGNPLEVYYPARHNSKH